MKKQTKSFIIQVGEKKEYNEYNKEKAMGASGSCFEEIIREIRALHN